ncbi:hypothetical protein QL285_007572 [Trifolium repens]|nr:hypothetical protein QL285_007572 [Trifolium repens]
MYFDWNEGLKPCFVSLCFLYDCIVLLNRINTLFCFLLAVSGLFPGRLCCFVHCVFVSCSFVSLHNCNKLLIFKEIMLMTARRRNMVGVGTAGAAASERGRS